MDFGLGLVLSFTDNATAGINNAVNSLNQRSPERVQFQTGSAYRKHERSGRNNWRNAEGAVHLPVCIRGGGRPERRLEVHGLAADG